MPLALDPLFSDGALLQREMPVPVWGTAKAGESITVSLQGASASTVADDQGAWRCELPPLAASDCETLVVSGASETIEVRDVAIGEVFIAGGQSNMEFWMRYERHLADALATCENPRVCGFGRRSEPGPQARRAFAQRCDHPLRAGQLAGD